MVRRRAAPSRPMLPQPFESEPILRGARKSALLTMRSLGVVKGTEEPRPRSGSQPRSLIRIRFDRSRPAIPALSSPPPMSLLRLYTRVLELLGKEARLGWILAGANLLLAAAQFAEPVLFGRIVDVLSGKPQTGPLSANS